MPHTPGTTDLAAALSYPRTVTEPAGQRIVTTPDEYREHLALMRHEIDLTRDRLREQQNGS